LRPGGAVAVDNLLWGGRASGARVDDRVPDTQAIRSFNAKFVSHPQLDATILSVGDGLGLGVKRS
jgi:caffeoyl-CoA O-methyltransferase